MSLGRDSLRDFWVAVGFFTRLPVPRWVGHGPEGLDRASRYFPAVGVGVGLLAAFSFMLASVIFPKTLAVLFSLALTLVATGALHEDGLADTVDGLGGAWDKARALEIMKDSRVGSYGVIALVVVILSRFMALVELPLYLVPAAMVAGHGLSRWAALGLMPGLPYARTDDSAKSRPLAQPLGWSHWGLAGIPAWVGALWCLWFSPGRTLIGLLLAGGVTWWMYRWLARRLGGYTGDGLGATQQVAELAFYIGLLVAYQGRGA